VRTSVCVCMCVCVQSKTVFIFNCDLVPTTNSLQNSSGKCPHSGSRLPISQKNLRKSDKLHGSLYWASNKGSLYCASHCNCHVYTCARGHVFAMFPCSHLNENFEVENSTLLLCRKFVRILKCWIFGATRASSVSKRIYYELGSPTVIAWVCAHFSICSHLTIWMKPWEIKIQPLCSVWNFLECSNSEFLKIRRGVEK
jgi:hypothetical protein